MISKKGSNLRKNMHFGLHPLLNSLLECRVEIKAITIIGEARGRIIERC
jgi:vacuolar-type H+-ATPase subunit C/Vma6